MDSEVEAINALAMKASVDPDTMYLHEAMNQPDRSKFLRAMEKEANDQYENGNFEIVRRDTIPKGTKVLPMVWQMKRKRDIMTRAIKKYKARLNIDGSRMQKGVHYDQTYAPVASWNSIRLLLTLATSKQWCTKQIDYVLAFPQAPKEGDLYVEVPKGIDVEGGNKKKFALKVKRNIYGACDAGRIWFTHLKGKLEGIGFKQSNVDECVFYRGKVMYLLYTDDSILAGANEKEVDRAIEDIKRAGLDITVEGDIQDFLGIHIKKGKDGTMELSQPHLIDQIINDLRLEKANTHEADTPAVSSVILKRNRGSPEFDGHFRYRSVIGKLNYLERGSRSDISYATHQCARFVTDPKVEHGRAVKRIGRYLKRTRKEGTIYRPDTSKGLEVYVDASFCGDWDENETQDPDTARSRYGYDITYQGCPILWKSALATEICLSTTEAEYCGLSYALRDAIPIMELLKEMQRNGFKVGGHKAEIKCEVFEDNSGAIEIARIKKYRPRTKHLNVKLHHFRSYVDSNQISIKHIPSDKQPADCLTKPLNWEDLQRHRRTMLGW